MTVRSKLPPPLWQAWTVINQQLQPRLSFKGSCRGKFKCAALEFILTPWVDPRGWYRNY